MPEDHVYSARSEDTFQSVFHVLKMRISMCDFVSTDAKVFTPQWAFHRNPAQTAGYSQLKSLMPLGAGEQKLRAAVKSPSCKCWMVCLVYPKPYTPGCFSNPTQPDAAHGFAVVANHFDVRPGRTVLHNAVGGLVDVQVNGQVLVRNLQHKSQRRAPFGILRHSGPRRDGCVGSLPTSCSTRHRGAGTRRARRWFGSR